MRIPCPYCYTPFTSSELCKTHCDHEHADELDAPLGKDFYFADYLVEEQIFQELKAEFAGGIEPNMTAIEAKVDERMSRRQRLMALRLYISLWPCKHEDEDEDEDEEDDLTELEQPSGSVNKPCCLTSCCDGRKYFGEFLNVMSDAYNSDCSDSE